MNHERIAQREELVSTTRELMERIDGLQAQVNALNARIEHLENDLAAREYREELAESVALWKTEPAV